MVCAEGKVTDETEIGLPSEEQQRELRAAYAGRFKGPAPDAVLAELQSLYLLGVVIGSKMPPPPALPAEAMLSLIDELIERRRRGP
jgi:hypothetical protein